MSFVLRDANGAALVGVLALEDALRLMRFVDCRRAIEIVRVEDGVVMAIRPQSARSSCREQMRKAS